VLSALLDVELGAGVVDSDAAGPAEPADAAGSALADAL
jgi:hypothetical protein